MNPDDNLCYKPKYVTGTNAPNLIFPYNFSDYVNQYNKAKSSYKFTYDCPATAPYYDNNNKGCVSCPNDYPYFNLSTSMCQNCGGS